MRRMAERTRGSVALSRMKIADVEQASTPRNRNRYLRNIGGYAAYQQAATQPIVL